MNILLESKNIYTKQRIKSADFEEVDTAYLFTNEMISSYMPNLSNQSVLAVASCGDHYFNALLNEAYNVDLFDINYISKFIIYLKKAGFEYLDYDTFCIFFGLYDAHHIFDYDIYQSFSKFLTDEVATYWNYLYKLTKNHGYSIYESDIISDYHHHTEEVLASNKYFKEEEFLKLKKILANIPDISFIHTDINELPFLLQRKYDSMFLSNIGTYQNNTTFIKTVRRLAKHLNDDGKIYFAYLYGDVSEKAQFYHKLLHSSHYKIKSISTAVESCQNHKVYIYSKS